MTIVFGNLVDSFNDFGAGGSTRDRFRDAVNDNTSVEDSVHYLLLPE